MPALRPTHYVLLLAYLASAAALVFFMFQLRQRTIATYSTPQQQEEWETWREAAGNEPAGGVERQMPSSAEPPALVLMRDYFAMCLAASLLFGTALYAVMAVAVLGTFRTVTLPEDTTGGPRR